MLWALSSTGRGVTRCQYLPGRSAMADPAQRRVTSCLLSRFAPGPSLAELQARERRFVLDCVAVERISRDYSGSLPKLGSVIPPYNSQRDPHVRAYFHSRPVPPLLQKTGQAILPSTIEAMASSFPLLNPCLDTMGNLATEETHPPYDECPPRLALLPAPHCIDSLPMIFTVFPT
eukprot:XP_017950269.1 PREDICTED: uncharacterized protein LOC100494322 isoform X2 [Xenopus tropicalis]